MSKPFSFANLVGGGQRPRAEAEDDQTAEGAAAAEEDKTEAEGEMAEEHDESAASAEDGGDAARRAVLAERARTAAILSLATPDTAAQAAALATQTDLTVEQAGAVLAAAPKSTGGLTAAMRGRAAAPVAPAAADTSASSLPPELQAAQARLTIKER